MISESDYIFRISKVGQRFQELGRCSKCKLYPKCKGIKLLCNPDDNPNNPNSNPNNPFKNFRHIKEKII